MSSKKVRKLIAADGKRDRRLWEIATLAVLRERLRSGDVWVEGGRAFCPLETQLVPIPDFAARKAAGDLRLGVPHDHLMFTDSGHLRTTLVVTPASREHKDLWGFNGSEFVGRQRIAGQGC